MRLREIFQYEDGVIPNSLAIFYVLVGYGYAIFLLLQMSVPANISGMLLLCSTLVISAYLVHELAHGTIFRNKRYSQALAGFLLWTTGSYQIRFHDIQKIHHNHHAKCADIVTFDIKSFLHEHTILRAVTLSLEWLFIPAVDIIMRWVAIANILSGSSPFSHRIRLLSLLATRLVFFGILAFMSQISLLLYMTGYFLFLHVLRFLDTHQHTYEAYPCEPSGKIPTLPERDNNYEEENTFSNLISRRFPLLDLFALNFAYHNIHHAKPTEPWYRLPALHRSYYGDTSENVLPARSLVGNYIRNRVARIVSENCGEVIGNGPDRSNNFIGAVAVSFLY